MISNPLRNKTLDCGDARSTLDSGWLLLGIQEVKATAEKVPDSDCYRELKSMLTCMACKLLLTVIRLFHC
jgi:hypothetical protein